MGEPSAPVREQNGLFELTAPLHGERFYNDDLAPTGVARRTWSRWHIASLWVGMCVCVPTYMLAAGLLKGGMNWWQAILTITLGNAIVLVPMVLNAHAGTKYGIPFPVFLRAPFGTLGSNVPAMLRAIVACGWFGIQTWIGGLAIFKLAAVMAPSLEQAEAIPGLGITAGQLVCFLLFWAVNVYFILAGTESIKWLETLSAPFLIVIGLVMLGWAVAKAGGIGTILSESDRFRRSSATLEWVTQGGDSKPVWDLKVDPLSHAREVRYAVDDAPLEQASWMPVAAVNQTVGEIAAPPKSVRVQFRGETGNAEAAPTSKPMELKIPAPGPASPSSDWFWAVFLPSLTAMVGFWATLSLNIPDFTRFAKSQADQMIGQAVGLPPTMALYSFIGVAVTAASLLVFPDLLVTEEAPWDPVDFLGRFRSRLMIVVSMVMLTVATLTTNIAANVVSPANDISNLAPSKISFKLGGMITAVIGIVMMPWKLLATHGTYIFTWLIGYGALLGPIGGIMIADYYVVRRARLELADLYKAQGAYAYRGGFNWFAIGVLLVSILPNLPGFLMTAGFAKADAFPGVFATIYTYAWFAGFAIAFTLYALLAPRPKSTWGQSLINH